MYRVGEQYAVFEATLREVESLADHFSWITWIGYPYDQNDGLGRLPQKANILLKQFPLATGGKSVWLKLKIVPYLPFIWFQIIKELVAHDVVHTRGPSVPALLTVLTGFFYRKKYWHKYAGNWRQKVLPKAYALQRYVLRKCNNFVAVNGRLPQDPPSICTIENPCFSEGELTQSQQAAQRKQFTSKLILLFVGRVEPQKGIFELLEAFGQVKDRMELHVVGSGNSLREAEEYARTNHLPVHFHGALQRAALNQLYSSAHILILPSRAEGFPKVIAEGAGFGCVPICSDISSIGEYIQHGTNGFLIKNVSTRSIAELLLALPAPSVLKEISQRASMLAELFTYERYVNQIQLKLTFDK